MTIIIVTFKICILKIVIFLNKDDGLFLAQRFLSFLKTVLEGFVILSKKTLLLLDTLEKCQIPFYAEKENDCTSVNCTSGV